ncbi:histidine kinase [Nostoc sp.]
MGSGEWGAGEAGEEELLIIDQCPMPNAQCPMPHAPCPITIDY